MTTNLARGPLPLCSTHNVGHHSTLSAWDQLWGTYDLRRTEEKHARFTPSEGRGTYVLWKLGMMVGGELRETERLLGCKRSRVWGGRENRGSPHCCHGNTDKSNCACKHHCVSIFLSRSPRAEQNEQNWGEERPRLWRSPPKRLHPGWLDTVYGRTSCQGFLSGVSSGFGADRGKPCMQSASSTERDLMVEGPDGQQDWSPPWGAAEGSLIRWAQREAPLCPRTSHEAQGC